MNIETDNCLLGKYVDLVEVSAGDISLDEAAFYENECGCEDCQNGLSAANLELTEAFDNEDECSSDIFGRLVDPR